MKSIESLTGFRQKLLEENQILLFFHNPENEVSKCAFRSITEACYLSNKTSVYVADISQVKDLHVFYEVNEFPALLHFIDGKLVNTLRGCKKSEEIRSFMNNTNEA